MIQHLWQFFPFLHVHRSGRRHVMHLMLVAFVLMGLPALAGAQASDTVSVAIMATALTEGFASVSAGGGGLGSHTCGLRETGRVECWGNDEFGQSTPPSGTFTSISLGGYHTCGLRDTGEAVCWGRNTSDQSTPPAGIFTSLSAGTWHTCGVRETGRLECWGASSDGRADPPAGTFISVSAGFHTCGVRETGRVECWGRDFSGTI